MNEQLQSKPVEILAGIQSATKAAGDFALEKLPDIAQQYVAYGRAINTAAVILGVLLLATSVAMVRNGFRNNQKRADAGLEYSFQHKPGLPGSQEGFIVSGFACGVLGGLFVLFNSAPAAMVWFAPKVWLLKEIASLLK